MKEIKIVAPHSDYIEAAAEIAAKAWIPIREVDKEILGEEIYNFLYENWQETKKRAVHNFLNAGKGFIALCDNKVVGLTTYNIDEKSQIGEIFNNAVSPDARGLGIAGKLNNAVLNLFKEKKCVAAQVSTGLDDGHAPARKAYEKLGFSRGLPQVEYYMKLEETYKEENPGDLIIIPMKEEHTDKVLEIAYASWEAIHAAYKDCLGEELYYLVKHDWKKVFKESLLKSFKAADFYVAILNGEIHGFCSLRYEKDGKLGIFGYNGVSLSSRGLRIASRMYGFLKGELLKKGCQYARVHTGLDDGHAPARRAYERTGFAHPVPMITYYMPL